MLIPQEEINNQKLFDVYGSAYMQPEQDEDGDVFVRIDGINVHSRVFPDRPFFVVSTAFRAKKGTDRMQVLELCNRINDNMILIRACCPDSVDEPGIYFDHFTMTQGGITGEEIVAVTRRFVKVIVEGLEEYNTEDIIN